MIIITIIKRDHLPVAHSPCCSHDEDISGLLRTPHFVMRSHGTMCSGSLTYLVLSIHVQQHLPLLGVPRGVHYLATKHRGRLYPCNTQRPAADVVLCCADVAWVCGCVLHVCDSPGCCSR